MRRLSSTTASRSGRLAPPAAESGALPPKAAVDLVDQVARDRRVLGEQEQRPAQHRLAGLEAGAEQHRDMPCNLLLGRQFAGLVRRVGDDRKQIAVVQLAALGGGEIDHAAFNLVGEPDHAPERGAGHADRTQLHVQPGVQHTVLRRPSRPAHGHAPGRRRTKARSRPSASGVRSAAQDRPACRAASSRPRAPPARRCCRRADRWHASAAAAPAACGNACA